MQRVVVIGLMLAMAPGLSAQNAARAGLGLGTSARGDLSGQGPQVLLWLPVWARQDRLMIRAEGALEQLTLDGGAHSCELISKSQCLGREEKILAAMAGVSGVLALSRSTRRVAPYVVPVSVRVGHFGVQGSEWGGNALICVEDGVIVSCENSAPRSALLERSSYGMTMGAGSGARIRAGRLDIHIEALLSRVVTGHHARTQSTLTSVVGLGAEGSRTHSNREQQLPADGSRIRVAIREERRQPETQFRQRQYLRGQLLRHTEDSVYLAPSAATTPLAIARDSIVAVWVSEGDPSRIESALLHGAVLALYMTGIRQFAASSRAEPRRDAVVTSAVFGFAVGAFIGGRYPPERWLRLP